MESGITQKATRKNAIIVSVYRPFVVNHIPQKKIGNDQGLNFCGKRFTTSLFHSARQATKVENFITK